MRFEYLDPRQGPIGGRVAPAPRLATLDGARIGILWNGRPGGDTVLREIARILDERHRFADVCFVAKPYLGNEAPEAMLDELQARVDAAIVGVGD